MNILSIFSSSDTIAFSRTLAEKIGVLEALALSELIEQYNTANQNGKLVNGNYFYCTANKLRKATCLNTRRLESAIKGLIKLRIIETKLLGTSRRRHFRINFNRILKLLGFDKTLKVEQIDILDVESGDKDLWGESIEETNSDGKKTLPTKLPYFTESLALYFEFHIEKAGIKPNMKDGTEGKALKELIVYFGEETKEGSTPFDVIKYILDNWEDLDEYQQKRIKLAQIRTDISNILLQMRNKGIPGKTSYKQRMKEYVNKKKN